MLTWPNRAPAEGQPTVSRYEGRGGDFDQTLTLTVGDSLDWLSRILADTGRCRLRDRSPGPRHKWGRGLREAWLKCDQESLGHSLPPPPSLCPSLSGGHTCFRGVSCDSCLPDWNTHITGVHILWFFSFMCTDIFRPAHPKPNLSTVSLSPFLLYSSLFFRSFRRKLWNSPFTGLFFTISINLVTLSPYLALEFLSAPTPYHGCVTTRLCLLTPPSVLLMCNRSTGSLITLSHNLIFSCLWWLLTFSAWHVNLGWLSHDAGPLFPKAWNSCSLRALNTLCVCLCAPLSPECLHLTQILHFLWSIEARATSSF